MHCWFKSLVTQLVDKMHNLATKGDFCTVLVLGTSNLDFQVATTDMWRRGLKVPKGAYAAR